MTVRIGGKEIAAVFVAGETAQRSGAQAVREFISIIREVSGEDAEIGDPELWKLGGINIEAERVPPFG